MRPAPGKRTLICIDLVGNCLVHGLPTTPVVWSLDGIKPTDKAPPTWLCRACSCLNPSVISACASCGGAQPAKVIGKPREVPKTDGCKLVELTPEVMEAIRAMISGELYAKTRFDAEPTVLGRVKEYAAGWIWHHRREQRQEAVVGPPAPTGMGRGLRLLGAMLPTDVAISRDGTGINPRGGRMAWFASLPPLNRSLRQLPLRWFGGGVVVAAAFFVTLLALGSIR